MSSYTKSSTALSEWKSRWEGVGLWVNPTHGELEFLFAWTLAPRILIKANDLMHVEAYQWDSG